MLSTRRTGAGLGALALAATMAALAAGAATAHAVPDACDTECEKALEEARGNTEQYWQVDAAIRDGYVESSACEPSPSGEGTIGIQYTNPTRAAEPDVNPGQPESLIYMPEGFARLGRRLVAVEYSVPVLEEGQAPPPPLFGRQFDGPDSDATGVPHFRLRVWLFSENPNGLFEFANPAEACEGNQLLVPHPFAFEQNVHEVLARFPVEAKQVREVLGVPKELHLRGEDEQGGGDAQLWLAARLSNWSSGDGSTARTLMAVPFLTLEAPDWASSGDAGIPALYPFSMVTDNRGVVNWVRQGMGVGSDVIRYSGDLDRDPNPGIGLTGPNYRFSSPEFVLEATIAPTGLHDQAIPLRIWHEGSRGMGLFRLWHDGYRSGSADVDVTPTPGTDLARLLGCDSPRCKSADLAVVVITHAPSPWAATASREWWNPRHDAALASAG